MDMIQKVYVAGPMNGYSYEDAMEWRRFLEAQLREIGLRGLHPEADGTGWKPGENLWFRDKDWLDIQAVDEMLVNQADALIANFSYATDFPTIGSIAEISWAAHDGKPVIVIRGEAAWTKHPFIENQSVARVDSIPAAIAALTRLQGYRR